MNPEDNTMTKSIPEFNGTIFHSNWQLVKTDGIECNEYRLSNIWVTSALSSSDEHMSIYGLVTVKTFQVSMQSVPLKITIPNNKAIEIWLDPARTNGVFGDGPIYGTVVRLSSSS